jgi:diguanylate cyclase (GGDEF)-like protein/PAS domain S-box-containing protein
MKKPSNTKFLSPLNIVILFLCIWIIEYILIYVANSQFPFLFNPLSLSLVVFIPLALFVLLIANRLNPKSAITIHPSGKVEPETMPTPNEIIQREDCTVLDYLEKFSSTGSFKYDLSKNIFYNLSDESYSMMELDTSQDKFSLTEISILFNCDNCISIPSETKSFGFLKTEERILTKKYDNKKIKMVFIYAPKEEKNCLYGLFIDISDEWIKEKEFYFTSFAVDKSSEEIYFTDLNGYIIYANQTARKSYNISLYDYNKKKIMDFDTNIDRNWWYHILLPKLNQSSTYTYETHIKTSMNSSLKFLEVHCSLISNNNEKYICSFARDITSRKKFEKDLKHIATHDQLSKIYNRHGIYENMQEMFKKDKFAVIIIDLDNFKPVNDTYGHEAGDIIIATLAQRLKSSSPYGSIVGRMSGDEFIIIIPEYGDLNNLENSIKEIYNSITKKYIIPHGVCQIGASMGISLYPENGSSRTELFRKADEAMYSVKTGGKNNYTFYKENQPIEIS